MEPVREDDRPGVHCHRATPEIFVGYQKGSIGNMEGYFPQAVHKYHDPGVYIEGRIYLHGDFFVHKHFVKLETETYEEGKVILRYQAKEVYAVIDGIGDTNFEVIVTQDDGFLGADFAGKDIQIDNIGRTYISVTNQKLYSIINNFEYGEHVLKLTSRSRGFAFYAASFISAPIGESISRN